MPNALLGCIKAQGINLFLLRHKKGPDVGPSVAGFLDWLVADGPKSGSSAAKRPLQWTRLAVGTAIIL
jgi:hypothetical protein